jgi:hypothetical protein
MASVWSASLAVIGTVPIGDADFGGVCNVDAVAHRVAVALLDHVSSWPP